jgi:hypothetical protein
VLDTAGVNAKDATDAIAGNLYLMEVYSTDFPPVHTFNPTEPLDREYDHIVKKNTEYLSKMHLF